MSQDSVAEVVSFERFLERRRLNGGQATPNDGVEPPASTDPATSAKQSSEPRTTKTMAVARQLPANDTVIVEPGT